MTIVSLDFETANPSRVSICAAGLAVFVDGQLTESPYWLVKPPKGYGWFHEKFIDCHGLTHLDMVEAPEFPDIAQELLACLGHADLVVAHKADFDMDCLCQILEHFGLACPNFEYVCTLQLARRVWPQLPNHKLDTLAAHIGHPFKHHHAQADAEVAGRLLLAIMAQVKATTLQELIRNAGLDLNRLGF